MSRNVVISAGANEPWSLVITETNGEDITTATFRAQLALYCDKPTEAAWAAPASVAFTGTTVATVAAQVNDATASADSDYVLWVEMTDGTSVYVLGAPELIHAT